MSSEKCYPTSPAGERDAGLEIARFKPCTKRTWCVLTEEHSGNCVEVPRVRGNRVAPAAIVRQRELGWPDFHPEDYCHKCGLAFDSWWCERETWMAATSRWAAETGREGICCMTCFTEMHKTATGAGLVWELRRT